MEKNGRQKIAPFPPLSRVLCKSQRALTTAGASEAIASMEEAITSMGEAVSVSRRRAVSRETIETV